MKQLSLQESQQVSGGGTTIEPTGIGSAIGILAGAAIGLNNMYKAGSMSPLNAGMTFSYMLAGKALGNLVEFAYQIYSFTIPEELEFDEEMTFDINKYDWDSIGR